MIRIPNHYKPMQLNKGIVYQELEPSPGLAGLIVFLWQIRNPGGEWLLYSIIPDGAVDLVADMYGDHRLKVSVSQASPLQLPIPPGASLWGVRLYPSGLSGAFAFYCPAKDLYLAGTVNQLSHPSASFRLMLRVAERLGL